MKCRIGTRTIAIASGKGGVGKSTITANLAVSLVQQGYSVGILDADLFGPSIPIMFGLRRMSPRTFKAADGSEKIFPLTKFGVSLLSIGFFLEEANAALWRGPVLHAILEKMLAKTQWQDLDWLLIDLPPGTGDILISLEKLLMIDSALIVCTPQEVAILDALKAIHAFDQLKVPLSGIVENMAGFTVPETEITYHLFGQGKAAELARNCAVPLLASIPLIPAIRIGGDEGCPAALYKSEQQTGAVFATLARAVAKG
jgi:ATP-binding protein involved in chromosome partitioning